MKKSDKKWGFLARTKEEAERMEAKYGVHFTPLLEYMKVIFPDIDDWEEEQFVDFGYNEDGEQEYIKPDFCSFSGHKMLSIGRYTDLYDEDYGLTYSSVSLVNQSELGEGTFYWIDNNTQLTNATVKQIFGVDVKEPLFDENTPTISQPWVHIDTSRNAKEALEGKYIGDKKQYQVNFDAYQATYENIGLSKIIVEKLFDLYDYEIDLNTDKKISILIGPNGCGKTTILKIVRFILSGIGDSEEIAQIPFKSITCILANGREKKLQNSDGKLSSFIDNEKVTSFSDYNRFIDNSRFNVELITAQRLLGKINEEEAEEENDEVNVNQYFDTISKIKNEFRHFCEKTERDYNSIKSRKEHYLFNEYILGTTVKLEDSIFEKEWDDFSKRRKECEQDKALNSKYKYNIEDTQDKEISIFDPIKDDVIIGKYKNNHSKKEFLCTYLQTFKDTLFEIEEAHKKTMLFQEIINKRFEITKKQLQYRFGEMYLTVGEGKSKKEIPLDVLSSGEKNDFIMFYNLIFNCKNSKVFIDEPEISLHIEWQERYIDDLSEICEMNNIQALVATHSPNIINDHTDLIAKWDVKDGR